MQNDPWWMGTCGAAGGKGRGRSRSRDRDQKKDRVRETSAERRAKIAEWNKAKKDVVEEPPDPAPE